MGRWFRGLLLLLLVLFQSHWLDDVRSGGADTAGIAVSAIGSLALVVGLLVRGVAARALLALGLAFIAFISIADLAGLQADGSRVPDLTHHWSSDLGWTLTVVVAATLLCALLALVTLRATRRSPSSAPRRSARR